MIYVKGVEISPGAGRVDRYDIRLDLATDAKGMRAIVEALSGVIPDIRNMVRAPLALPQSREVEAEFIDE